eukprot:349673_1
MTTSFIEDVQMDTSIQLRKYINNEDFNNYEKWVQQSYRQRLEMNKKLNYKPMTDDQLYKYHSPDVLMYNNSEYKYNQSFIQNQIKAFQLTDEFSSNSTWCYNCFVSGQQYHLLVCSKCKLAKYCSVKCQSENWKYHKKTCTSKILIFLNTKQDSQMDSNILYTNLQALIKEFTYLHLDCNTIIKILTIETGYKLFMQNKLEINDVCLNALPFEKYFTQIDLMMHNIFRWFGFSKAKCVDYYQTFWSIPGMVEYLLHQSFVMKDITKLRQNGIGYFDNIAENKKQYEDILEIVYITNDGLNCFAQKWGWWVISVFSRTVTNDAMIPRNSSPYAGVDEGKSQFLNEHIMGMINIVKRKLVKSFLDLDVLHCCNDAFMPIVTNIMVSYFRNCHVDIKKELISQGLLLSLLYVSNKSNNKFGVYNLLKLIKISHIQHLNVDDKIVLFIVIFKSYNSFKPFLDCDRSYQWGDEYLRKKFDANKFDKWKKHDLEKWKCKKKEYEKWKKLFNGIVDNNVNTFIKMLKKIIHFKINHYSFGFDFTGYMNNSWVTCPLIAYFDKMFFYWCFKNVQKKKYVIESNKFMDYLYCEYAEFIDIVKSYMEKKKQERKFCYSPLCKNENVDKYYQCKQCSKTMYCCRKCQKIHWVMGHRQECLE